MSRRETLKVRRWFGAKNQKHQAAKPSYSATAYVQAVQQQVNAYASELLA